MQIKVNGRPVEIFAGARVRDVVRKYSRTEWGRVRKGIKTVRDAHLAAGDVFCEWGSGMAIATGLAELLGFRSHGIERDEALAAASRQLLAEFGFQATVETGDYLVLESRADVYFVYCWPGQMEQVKRRFEDIAPDEARLLICHGAEDIRCMIRTPGRTR